MHTFDHAFTALTLSVGRPDEHLAFKQIQSSGAGIVICLERRANFPQITP